MNDADIPEIKKTKEDTPLPKPEPKHEPETLTTQTVHINISDDASSAVHDDNATVELNVGGVLYTTSVRTLTERPHCRLADFFKKDPEAPPRRDSRGNIFIDRDGEVFRYILEYLRHLKVVLPDDFLDIERLKQEAEYYRLPELVSALSAAEATAHPTVESIGGSSPARVSRISREGSPGLIIEQADGTQTPTSRASIGDSSRVPAPQRSQDSVDVDKQARSLDRAPGYITVGYRGTFAFGRDGMGDVKFRKLNRIFVSGRLSLCREVFKNTLNETRDPVHDSKDHYTHRLFLNHTIIEEAFDMLQDAGFRLTGSCSSGTNSGGEVRGGVDTEEAKWQHYNEFIFERRS